MAETFQRPFNPNIQTQGEIADNNSMAIGAIGQAAQTIDKGLRTKFALDALAEEKDKEDRVRTTADRLADEAQAMSDEGRPASEVQSFLTRSLRDLDPTIQSEVQAFIAQSRAQGGIDIQMTQEDIIREQEQQLINRETQALIAEGVNPRNYSTDQLRELGYMKNKVQAQLLQQQQDLERINASTTSTDKEKAQATTSWLNQVNATLQVGRGALALKVEGIDSSEEYLNLLNGQETVLQQTRARVKQKAEEQLSLLQTQDAKDALIAELDRSMKSIDDQIEYVSGLKEKPLKDAKREVELLQTEFLQKHPQLDVIRQISSASQLLTPAQAQPFSQFLQKIGKEILSDQQARNFATLSSNPQATQQDFEAFYDTLSEEKSAELSLEYHKMVVDGYKGGSGELFNQASNSLLYIASRVDTAEPEQAQELFKLMASGKEALYKDMNDTQKRLFNYKITQSSRSTVGNPQSGLLADLVVAQDARGLIEDLGVDNQELFELKDGKLVIGQALLDKKEELEVNEKEIGFNRDRQKSALLSRLNAYLDRANKKLPALNSIITNTSGLDAPALEGLTPEQRIAYLTSNPAGVSLSDYSNIPSFTGNPSLVEEGIQRGKTTDEVVEERSEKQQVQAFNNATALLYQGSRAKDGEGKRAIIAQIEQIEGLDPQAKEDFISTLELQARRLDTDSSAAAKVNRAEEAEEVEGRPSSTEALPPVEEDVEFIDKAKEWSSTLNASTEDLLKLVQFETGGSFDPAQENLAGGSAVGLIQFMPEVIEELGTTREELVAMTRAEQMDVVGTYLQRILKRKGVTNPKLADLYMAVIRPESVGAASDSVVYKEPSTNYEKNKVLDVDGDGKITKAEATEKVNQMTNLESLRKLLKEANENGELAPTLSDMGLLGGD